MNLNNQQSKFNKSKKVIISLIGGIVSSVISVPIIIWILMWLVPFSYTFPYFFENLFEKMLEKGVSLYSISLALGVIGLVSGFRNIKSPEKNYYALVGVILSIIGIVASLIFFGFGFYFASFQ